MEELENKIEEVLSLYLKLNSYLEDRVMNYGGIELFPAEIHTLVFIRDNNELNATELAHKRSITKGAFSKTTGKLIAKGLITRDYRDGNQKNVYFNLTEDGINAYQAHAEFHARHYLKHQPELLRFVEANKSTLITALNYISEDIASYIKEIDKLEELKGGEANA